MSQRPAMIVIGPQARRIGGPASVAPASIAEAVLVAVEQATGKPRRSRRFGAPRPRVSNSRWPVAIAH